LNVCNSTEGVVDSISATEQIMILGVSVMAGKLLTNKPDAIRFSRENFLSTLF